MAALWHLPVLFLCENNQYAMGTALARHSADADISHKPRAYGIDAETVDGMDVYAVQRACRYACEAIREGGGPRFLTLQTYRFRAHSMYDAERYRSKEEVAQWKKRDPIELFTARLEAGALLTEAERKALEREAEDCVARAVQSAEQGAWEPEADLLRFVYSEASP